MTEPVSWTVYSACWIKSALDPKVIELTCIRLAFYISVYPVHLYIYNIIHFITYSDVHFTHFIYFGLFRLLLNQLHIPEIMLMEIESIGNSQIKSNQITFIVTSPQHKCLGEWNSYERAPDSAKKQQTIYLWTDSAKKNNRQFTYGQTVQKNNKQFTYGQTVQKKQQAIYIWTDSASL